MTEQAMEYSPAQGKKLERAMKEIINVSADVCEKNGCGFGNIEACFRLTAKSGARFHATVTVDFEPMDFVADVAEEENAAMLISALWNRANGGQK